MTTRQRQQIKTAMIEKILKNPVYLGESKVYELASKGLSKLTWDELNSIYIISVCQLDSREN